MAVNPNNLELANCVKKLLSFLVSTIWEINVDSSNGFYANIEDKSNEIINFLKAHNFTEEEMSCLNDISSEKLIALLLTTSKW